jgi:hypothetical protein
MGIEEIEVRITRSGEIYVKLDGATEQRIHDYRAFLEENIGPLQGGDIIRRPDWEQPAGWLSKEEEEKRKREQELRHG